MKYWFHNHTRGSSSGNGTRGVLKLSTVPKLLQPWQAYQNKFYDTKLKHKVEESWKEYLGQFPKGQKPEKTLFEFRNQMVQKFYREETDEIKQEVEEHRQAMKASKMGSDVSDDNAKLQEYVPFLARLPILSPYLMFALQGASINSLAPFRLRRRR